LIFDKDVDGVSSAVITSFAFKKLGIKFTENIPSFFAERKFINLKNFDGGVIVDVPLQMQENFLRKTKKKILVIDHHPSGDIESKNIFYINPRLIRKDIYQPVSYVAYKFFSNYIGMKEVKWIAIVGTVGDYGFEDVKDLLQEIKSKDKIWMNKYGRAATRLNAAIAVYGPKRSFDILNNCKGLNSFLKNKKIKSAHKKFSNEFWKADKKLKSTAEVYPDVSLIFSKVEPKYSRITAALASKVSTVKQDYLVILAEKQGEKYKIHGRMQNKRYDVGEILKKFGGGGHKQAGACVIDAKDLAIFKKKLIEILRKNK
jgi:single-stranded DNA-specific DHH superfamily exonuclease